MHQAEFREPILTFAGVDAACCGLARQDEVVAGVRCVARVDKRDGRTEHGAAAMLPGAENVGIEFRPDVDDVFVATLVGQVERRTIEHLVIDEPLLFADAEASDLSLQAVLLHVDAADEDRAAGGNADVRLWIGIVLTASHERCRLDRIRAFVPRLAEAQIDKRPHLLRIPLRLVPFLRQPGPNLAPWRVEGVDGETYVFAAVRVLRHSSRRIQHLLFAAFIEVLPARFAAIRDGLRDRRSVIILVPDQVEFLRLRIAPQKRLKEAAQRAGDVEHRLVACEITILCDRQAFGLGGRRALDDLGIIGVSIRTAFDDVVGVALAGNLEQPSIDLILDEYLERRRTQTGARVGSGDLEEASGEFLELLSVTSLAGLVLADP